MADEKELSDWYRVSFDDEFVYRDVAPPEKEAWNDQLRWQDIVRVCFHAGDMLQSDDIYVFTSERAESYIIPTKADGGQELLDEIVRRKLFDAELLIKAASATNELFCCPGLDVEIESGFSEMNSE